MDINPTLEKEFNQLARRCVAVLLMGVVALLALGTLFWLVRDFIPLSLSMGAGTLLISVWLFGAENEFQAILAKDSNTREAITS